jgi:hypothetical protein
MLVGIKYHYVEERNRNVDSLDNETNVDMHDSYSTTNYRGNKLRDHK